MGKLRIVPKSKEPGFISFNVDTNEQSVKEKKSEEESNIVLKMRRGLEIHVGRSVSLRQVARLAKMLDSGHGLG